MPVSAIPHGYHTITPYLICRDAAKAIEFYTAAFNAMELMRLSSPDGKIGHAEIKIGDSPVMLADEFPDYNAIGPQTLGGTTFGILLYVDDCDALFAQAIAAGAKQERPLTDQFYGDRSGTVIDPFGHKWTIATHKEDVSPEEMNKRFAAMTAG